MASLRLIFAICVSAFSAARVLGADPAVAEAADRQIPEPRGYYVLQSGRGNELVSDKLLTSPFLEGVVLRRRWRDVQPAAEKFDWGYLDREIGRAKVHGKKVQILIFTGADAPDWLYVAGARPLKFFDPRKGFGWFTMPVPWDDVMLTHYEKLMAALGRRYDAEGAITLVHVGGPTRLSLEFHLPREVSELDDWAPDRLLGAWDRSIRATAAAFPHKNIALNVSKVFHGSDGMAPSIAKRGVEILGRRATLQHDALAAKTAPGFPTHSLISEFGRRGCRIGFEMLSESGEQRFGGEFRSAVEIGRAAGAQYLNIYAADAPLLTAPYQAY